MHLVPVPASAIIWAPWTSYIARYIGTVLSFFLSCSSQGYREHQYLKVLSIHIIIYMRAGGIDCGMRDDSLHVYVLLDVFERALHITDRMSRMSRALSPSTNSLI
jgi:hypothetical protein